MIRWIATKMQDLAHRILYGRRVQCEVCKAWSHTTAKPEHRHAIDCPVPRSEADWKRVALQYYQSWKEGTEQRMRARYDASYWQGRFHSLRLENNALRKQTRGDQRVTGRLVSDERHDYGYTVEIMPDDGALVEKMIAEDRIGSGEVEVIFRDRPRRGVIPNNAAPGIPSNVEAGAG